MPLRFCSGCRALISPPATRCDACEALSVAAGRARRARSAANRPRRAYADGEYRRNAAIVCDRAWANGEVCVRCWLPFESRRDVTAEHLVAVRNGGTNALENLGPAHSGCNSAWNKGR